MTTHLLDRPVWGALTTRQARFASGGDRARRYAEDIGPLASARDDSVAALADLAALVPALGGLLLLQADSIALPPGTVATSTTTGVQMICERLPPPPVDADCARVRPLDESDFPAMLALAALTKPGPFAARTAVLGEFWGIVENGTLVAMAGERMKLAGYTEVSGVCAHPDVRGRGFARLLSALIATRIASRGDVPFLHAYATNTAAITLYESLGFRVRTAMHVAVIERA